MPPHRECLRIQSVAVGSSAIVSVVESFPLVYLYLRTTRRTVGDHRICEWVVLSILTLNSVAVPTDGAPAWCLEGEEDQQRLRRQEKMISNWQSSSRTYRTLIFCSPDRLVACNLSCCTVIKQRRVRCCDPRVSKKSEKNT